MPQSSLILKNLVTGIIPAWSLVVIDSEKAREYDSKIDSLDDVIGVVSTLEYISGRSWGPFYDGPQCYENDSILWNEDLTMTLDENEQTVENTNYVPYNPFTEPELFSIIICHGFAAVLASYGSIPTRWKLIKSNTTYNWILIR